MNAYRSQIIQPTLSIRIQLKQNTPLPGKNDNAFKNFGLNKNEKSTLEEQNIEKDYRNLIDESKNTKSHARNSLSGRIY